MSKNSKTSVTQTIAQQIRKLGTQPTILYAQLEAVARDVDKAKTFNPFTNQQSAQLEKIAAEIRAWKSDADGAYVFEDWAERLQNLGTPGVDAKPEYYAELDKLYQLGGLS